MKSIIFFIFFMVEVYDLNMYYIIHLCKLSITSTNEECPKFLYQDTTYEINFG